MNRRALITLLGRRDGVATRRTARAADGARVRRIGVLMAYAESDPDGQAFVAGVSARGPPEARLDGEPQYPGSTLAGRRPDVELMQRFAKGNRRGCGPDLISYAKTHPPPRRCVQQNAQHPHHFSRPPPIQSAAAFVAGLPPAGRATSPVSSIWRRPWPAKWAGAAQRDRAARSPWVAFLFINPATAPFCPNIT